MAPSLIAFPWYGGKYSHLKWLLPLLPACRHYVEPFGGSAAVLLNRAPSPMETYNDIDGEVVNFFRVLRENRDALIEQLRLTPYSRQEFVLSAGENDDIGDVERARRFFVRARMARDGLGQKPRASYWSFCVNVTYRGVSSSVLRWLNSIDGLTDVAARLAGVQIECYSWQNVVRLYDTSETLFYCDPPYDLSARDGIKAYKYELTDMQHRVISSSLHTINGRAAISGYRSPLYDRLYHDWQRIDIAVTTTAGPGINAQRIESLWTNYDPTTGNRLGS